VSTPRFRDLSPDAAADVVSAFLGKKSSTDFTEKLAGQHMTATRSSGRWNFSIKSGESGSGGFFPDVEDALIDFHPKGKSPVTYRFEVVNKYDRPDFIDYKLDRNTAIEFSGTMTSAVAEKLNSSQSTVKFLTKDDIRKPVSSLVSDPEVKSALRKFVSSVSRGGVPSPEETMQVEEMLMDLVDSGKIPSTLGGGRIEGLFGTAGEKGFKIPSREYADLQRQQAKFYAIVKGGKVYDAYDRFDAAARDPRSDRLVKDVLDYIDTLSKGKVGKGFRLFFSPAEARDLKRLAGKYETGKVQAGRDLARTFFARVRDRDSWASSGLQESAGINFSKSTQLHTSQNSNSPDVLLRLIREYMRLL
jgi:hypothetical protein